MTVGVGGVIAGVGVAGCGAAGYLTRFGRKDVVVLDRKSILDPVAGLMRGQESRDVAK